jgi:hypothetical protein
MRRLKMHHLKRQRHGCILATWRIRKVTGLRLELHIYEQIQNKEMLCDNLMLEESPRTGQT